MGLGNFSLGNLRDIVLKQLEAGNVCPKTLMPVQINVSRHMLGKHGVSEIEVPGRRNFNLCSNLFNFTGV